MSPAKKVWAWTFPGIVVFSVLLAGPPLVKFLNWYVAYWGF